MQAERKAPQIQATTDGRTTPHYYFQQPETTPPIRAKRGPANAMFPGKQSAQLTQTNQTITWLKVHPHMPIPITPMSLPVFYDYVPGMAPPCTRVLLVHLSMLYTEHRSYGAILLIYRLLCKPKNNSRKLKGLL